MVTETRRALRRALLPLGCYYTVTLLLPLANGAGQSGHAFVSHAAAVIAVPLLVIVLLGALAAVAKRVGRGLPLHRVDSAHGHASYALHDPRRRGALDDRQRESLSRALGQAGRPSVSRTA